MAAMKKFLLVLKKDLILQFRRPVITVVELLLPIVILSGLVVLRNFLPTFRIREQCFTTFEADQLIVPFTGNYTIHYTPNTNDTNKVASIIESRLPGSTLKATSTEDEVIEQIIKTEGAEMRDRGCFYNGAAIVFSNINGPNVSYTLRLRHESPTLNSRHTRWFTNRRTPLADPTGPRVYDNAYFNEGFLHLEHVVGQAIVQHLTGSWPHLPSLEMRQFPHKSFEEDMFLPNVEFILPFAVMASFFISVGLFTKELVLEKESRLRETLKMNGVSNGVLWSTWFIKQFLFLLLPVLVAAILLKYGNIFPHSHIGALLIFMLLYLLSILSFCFFISVWFDNSQVGMMAGFIFWFLTLLPHLFIAGYYTELNTTVKALGCLFPNACMGLGISVIALLELSGDGFQFNDFVEPLNSEDDFNMNYVIGILTLDCVLLMTVSWYMNEWRPGKYGIPRKFYFPFLPSYWTGKKSNKCCTTKGSVCPSQHSVLEEEEEAGAEGSNDGSSTHEDLSELQIGIEIKGLEKKFKANEYLRTEIKAVDNLHFKVYRGQITALLGHNGAGKTTTMSILTGLFPPDAGLARINGLSVMDDIDLIRRNLGICPQHNVLFDRLTVSEHLHFFAQLRGVPKRKVEDSIASILSDFQLESRKDYKASELSGGYKRKLCLAIALVGDPEFLILDEPTSGMDHKSRLLTWSILERKRSENKTILVSTHSLDDTERANRLAILVEGKLACSGRPAWLKKRYGIGYNLRIALGPRSATTRLEEVIRHHIKGCDPVTGGAELQGLLPLEEIGKFSDLFSELERSERELGIVSFSIQENKMEDVFIKVGEGKNQSWNTQVRQLSRMYSHPGLIPGRPGILPLSPSLNSVDLNTWAFQATTPLSDGVSRSTATASPFFPPPPVEDDDSWRFEEDDMSSTMTTDQLPGFPALDQSKVSRTQLPIHRRSEIKSPLSPGGVLMPPVEEEEEEEEEVPDGGVVLSIPVPNINKPKPKRLTELTSGECTPGHNPSLSRSRASSISSVSNAAVRPSIIDPIVDNTEREEERRRGGGGGRGGRRIGESVRKYLRNKLPNLSYSTRKWLQQYRAIIVKRSIHFRRFYIGAVCQFLPLLTIAISLIICETFVAQFVSDRSIHLTIENTSPSDNRSLFQASFVNGSLPLESLSLRKFGSNNLLNYTLDVIELKERVTTPTNVSQCCSYSHQILDKYCATVDKDELIDACRDVNGFGYVQCLEECLNCCNAKRHRLASCSSPRYQLIDNNFQYTPASDYCSVPPKLSLEDYADPEGPLDDINTFVAEHLLSLQESDPSFFVNLLGGFTISPPAPTHSVCGCQSRENGATCPASLHQVQLLNSLPPGQDCTGFLFLPYFCNDNVTFLNLTVPSVDIVSLLKQASMLLNCTSTDTDLSCDSTSLALPVNCSDIFDDLNAGSGCMTVSQGPLVTLFVDTSCSVCAGSSISSQYGYCNQWNNDESPTPVITLWYNNQAFHLSASILNVLHNLYLHTSGHSNLSVDVHNHPLPRRPSSTVDTASIDIITFSVGLLSMFGYCFLLASFSLFIVQEKSSMAKHLQLSAGLRLSAYWTGNFTWDLITCIIPVTLTIIIFAIGQIWVEQYSGLTLAAVAALFVMICWAQIPSIYLLSLPFNDIYTAYTSLFLVLFILSFSSLSVYFVIGPIAGYTSAADMLHYVFLVNPSYGLAAGLSDLYLNSIFRNVCESSTIAMATCAYKEVQYTDNPFRISRPGVGGILLYFTAEGFLYFFLTLFIDHFKQIKQYILRRRGMTSQRLVERAVSENRKLLKSRARSREQRNIATPGGGGGGGGGGDELLLSRRLSRLPSVPLDASMWGGGVLPKTRPRVKVDDSVKVEKTRVNNFLQKGDLPKDCTIAIGHLSKYYENSFLDYIKSAWNFEPLKEAAVQDMNIALHERQCFGLLGYNGAGKSTTFKMLTGEISATTGTALIAGYDIRTQLREVQKRIGYCPQFDALIETLTGRELLTLFARLRGIEEEKIKEEVDTQINKMGLIEHADKQCWKYSGGNRRKLSAAIALLGDPPVIMLDEPTSGMDIQTRRDFINILSRIVKDENKTVIFSSHSMSECESLCNRIGIMINGEFRVIGPTEELRDRYGDSSTKLTIRVEHCTMEELLEDEDFLIAESSTILDNPEAAFLHGHQTFLQVPQASPIPMRTAFLQVPNSNPPLHQPLNASQNAAVHQQLQRRPFRTISRLQSIRKAARDFIAHQGRIEEDARGQEETDGTSDESQDGEGLDNPYLQRVCLKIREYFRGKRDIKIISAEKDEVTYKLPKYDVPLSEIFKLMQLLKSDPSYHITSYSVSQSTLEQVYSHFIREQEEQELKKKLTPDDAMK